MRNLRFRSNASLALYNNRPHRLRWLLPTLLLATGSLYGALQLKWGDDHLHVAGQTANPVALPLRLPNDQPVSVATDPIPAPAPAPAHSPVISIPEAPYEPLGDLNESESLTSAAETAKPVKKDHWLVHEIQPGDSLARIFKNLGLSAKLLNQIVHSGKPAGQLARIKPGQTLQIHFDAEDKFAEMLYQIDPARKLRVARDGDGLAAALLERDVDVQNKAVATDPIPAPAPAHSHVISIPEAPNEPLGDLNESESLASASETETAKLEETDRWLVHEIQPGDSLARIFKNLGLSAKLLNQIVHSGKPAGRLARIKPGQTLQIHFDAEDKFAEMLYQIDPTRKLRVARDGDGLAAALLERDVDVQNNEISAVIESSLFESAQRAGLSDVLTMQLAKIFGWDIDFALGIRSGDRFSVVFSEQMLDGKKLEDGPILAAEFVNKGKVYRAVRFVDASGKTGYYTPEGKRMKKEFLRTPLKFSRISSTFTQRRWHPVLKKQRAHKGVDYAAPTGTPVKAAGDAKVTFIGRKGGFGKVIFLQHQGKYTTVYGHLSRFAKGMKKGKRVKQGQLIGYVGQTGLATGPHLHYEFRVNGKHRNPLKVTQLPAAPIDRKYLPAFKKATQPLLARLDTLNRTMVADAL